jgi:NADH:ubiquinone oxidoreductase subunit F (NADH-binding)
LLEWAVRRQKLADCCENCDPCDRVLFQQHEQEKELAKNKVEAETIAKFSSIVGKHEAGLLCSGTPMTLNPF